MNSGRYAFAFVDGHFQTLAAHHQMSVDEVAADLNLPKKCNEPISDLTLVHNLLD